MALSRSLSTGTSAILAQQSAFEVISNNIANSSTTGYKSTTANFADTLSQLYRAGTSSDTSSGLGGTNPNQIGTGVSYTGTSTNMNDGDVTTTDRPLDMAISGSGYFVYNANGVQEYSRSGQITWDESGNLVNSTTGAYLQGYNATSAKGSDGNNVLDAKLSNLVISQDVVSAPKQTESVTVKGNLDSSAAVNDTRATSISIYDESGTARTLNLTYTKTAANTYSITGTLDGNAVTLSASSIAFNSDGSIKSVGASTTSPFNLTVTGANLNTALGASSTAFDATKSLTIGLGTSGSVSGGLTNYDASSTATCSAQDGYSVGTLTDLSVDSNGKIWGAFSNSRSELLGQSAVATFANPEALRKTGANMLTVSPNSGLATIGTAGETFSSTSITGGALESSNVDLTTQFTDMISTQRAYEAAARIITVTDTLLQETTSLKRS